MKKWIVFVLFFGLASFVVAENVRREGKCPTTRPAPKLDTDADGFISLDEFLAPAKQAFERMDTDKDGKLSPEEFKPMRPERPGMGGPDRERGPNGRHEGRGEGCRCHGHGCCG